MKFEQKPDNVNYFAVPGERYLNYFPRGMYPDWKPEKREVSTPLANSATRSVNQRALEELKSSERRKLQMVQDRKRRRGAE